jgi:hypothetical protein
VAQYPDLPGQQCWCWLIWSGSKPFTAFQQTAVTERETAVVVGQMAEADFTAVVAHLMK